VVTARLDTAELDAQVVDAFASALQRETPHLVADHDDLAMMLVRGTGVLARTHARIAAGGALPRPVAAPVPPSSAEVPSEEVGRRRARATGVLARTHARIAAGGALPRPVAAPVPPPSAEVPSEEVGRRRARAGVHPTQSLRAASCLVRAALPRLLGHYPDAPPDVVALALHASIDDLLMAASVTYVEVLLDRITEANLDERRRVARDLHDRTSHGIGAAMQGVDLALHVLSRRVARDLHDRTSHGIGAAMQGVDLALHVLSRGGTPDAERLTATRAVLLETLDDVRGMATRLRDAVGGRGLVQALREHLDHAAPQEVRVTVALDGDDAVLPGYLVEEAYLVLREAVRNALAHARPTRLDVAVSVRGGVLEAVVADDGSGFAVDAVDRTRTVGLASMRERAEGLGGRLVVDAAPGRGARVVLTVPFAGALA